MQNSHYKQSLHDRGVCVIIPTYNNAGTIADVVKRTLLHCDDVIVVNDGATDSTKEILTGISGITLINSPKNEGKGAALRRGFRKALEQGFTYAITLDADGQHYPEDLPLFLEANIEHPGCLIVGERNLEGVERSKGSSFANAFSNFWFCVQTFHRLPDTQTGYRLYPLKKLIGLSLLTSRYEAELELMEKIQVLLLVILNAVTLFSNGTLDDRTTLMIMGQTCDPNDFVGYFVFPLTVALKKLVSGKHFPFYLSLISVSLYCIFLSGSRGGFLAIAVTITGFAVIYPSNNAKRFLFFTCG